VGQDAGNNIEGDQPLRVAAFRVDGEGNTDAAEQHLGFPPLLFQCLLPGGVKETPYLGIGGTNGAIGVHLVEGGGSSICHGWFRLPLR
jgi:hypothetical protein